MSLVKDVLGVAAVDRNVDETEAEARPFGLVFTILVINASIALFLAALAANASRAGYDSAVLSLYLCVALLFAPIATRLMLPAVARPERIGLVLLATTALYILRTIRAPLLFVDHDEYLHAVSAQDILLTGQLFTTNSLFPIGPSYPGLHIATTAISSLTGLSVFVSSVILIGVARLLFISALFVFLERVSGSARVAGLGAVFYMGCSTFVFFDAHFAYASLALPLMAIALALDVGWSGPSAVRPTFAVSVFPVVVLALVMTHHMTSYGLAGLLAGFLILELIRQRGLMNAPGLWFKAAVALTIPILWSKAMGNPGGGYLGPVLENGIREVLQLLSGFSNRKLFTSDDGTLAPAWQRYTTLGSVALIALGLAIGFFRSLSWAEMPFARRLATLSPASVLTWSNSRLVLLTFITFGFPLAIIFRLTRSGWEIGNRLPPFVFLGVGAVLAIAVVTTLQGRSNNVVRAGLLGLVATVILTGGIISAEGPRVLVPQKYQISADAASIEPMGVETALWARERLGAGNRFVADRVNRLLLAGFGEQRVSTTLKHGFDTGVALVSLEFGAQERAVLKAVGIDYMIADLRMTQGLPVVGSYFDGGLADQMSAGPPEPKAFLKFDRMAGVNRIFDNGYQTIFDVRSISGRH